MIKWITCLTLILSLLISCGQEESAKENSTPTESKKQKDKSLSAGQQAAIDFCNCTHVIDSLEREDCYGIWVEGISKDSSIDDSEAKRMGKLMFECNPEETLRVLLLIED